MIKRHFVQGAPPSPNGVKYHHATEADGWLHVTGQIGIDPLAPDAPLVRGIEKQTEQTFENLEMIVNGSGYKLDETVFVRIYLTNYVRDFDGLNRVYHRWYSDDSSVPSRTTVGISALGREALVEIDLVLFRKK